MYVFKGLGLPLWVTIGTIAITTTLIATFIYRSSSKSKRRRRTLLEPNTKYPLKLVDKIDVSHDTRLFRFELPSKDHILGLPTGQHIHLTAMVSEQLVIRPYSPVSSDDDLGHMDLIIKVYYKDVHPKFPAGGKMTQYLNDLQLGQTVDVRGPSGNLLYKGRGEFAIRPDKKAPYNLFHVKRINMIAGGSGITPILQIIKAVFKDSSDKSSLSLIFANHTEEDILCRSDLEKIARRNPTKFKLHYTLGRPPADWKYSSGHINEKMLKDNFYPPSDDTIVLMCGPPPMIQFACTPALDSLNYNMKLRYAY